MNVQRNLTTSIRRLACGLLVLGPGLVWTWAAAASNENVFLFPSALDPLREGFVRVINHSAEAGEVAIDPLDDSGRKYDTIVLSIDANETKHFNSGDLETGNEGKGLTGSTGSGQGDWRLSFSSELDIEVLAYIRTEDGFLTSMHDIAPDARGRHRIVTFNPGSNTRQRSLLRLVNSGEDSANVAIRGIDDHGVSPGSQVRVTVPARASTTLSSADLESGGDGFAGALGDGSGKWRLLVDSEQPIKAMSLLSSPTGHLTNLSTAPGRDDGPPRLVSPGAIGMEWDLWEADVAHGFIQFRFAADFDSDGDDDLVLAGGSSDPMRPQDGVILLNNGDFTFTVAGGDRPAGVHPREVLLADFDSDGVTDLFIADHGHDALNTGWHNQLLLWTPGGYRDATENMPDDPTGFTHNAAVGDVDGDGDMDILVANAFGDWIFGPYLLINDGQAEFVANTERLPDSMEADFRPWAVEIVDLDDDGYEDLVAGATSDDPDGESFVYWGSESGEYRDEDATTIPKAGFFAGFGAAEVISIGVHDCNGDSLPDLLLGGYDAEIASHRGVQLLLNNGEREFFDKTRYRLGDYSWSSTEAWHEGHRFFDFNQDGTVDIVPQHYGGLVDGAPNILAWLNDGMCRYVPLRTMEFDDERALWRFAWGTLVRVGAEFKAMWFGGDGATHLSSNAAVVVENAEITLAQAITPK